MKTLTAIAIALGLTFATGSAALADQPAEAANKGNQGCTLLIDGSEHKNPGKMFQHIRENSEAFGFDANQNPVEWLANFPGFEGNVGDFVKRNCQPPVN